MQLVNKGLEGMKEIFKICRMDKEVLMSVTQDIEKKAERIDRRQCAKNSGDEFLCIKCQTEWTH